MYTESLIFVNIIGSRIRNSVANLQHSFLTQFSSPTLPTEQLFANWFATVCQLIPKKKRDFTVEIIVIETLLDIFLHYWFRYGNIEMVQALLLTVIRSYRCIHYRKYMKILLINTCEPCDAILNVLRNLPIQAYIVDYYHWNYSVYHYRII